MAVPLISPGKKSELRSAVLDSAPSWGLFFPTCKLTCILSLVMCLEFFTMIAKF